MSHWSLRGLREINCPRLILIRNGIRHKSTGERYLDIPQQPTKVNNKVLFIYYLSGHFNYSTLKELILNGTGTPYQSESFPLGPWYNKFLSINVHLLHSSQASTDQLVRKDHFDRERAKSLAKYIFILIFILDVQNLHDSLYHTAISYMLYDIAAWLILNVIWKRFIERTLCHWQLKQTIFIYRSKNTQYEWII